MLIGEGINPPLELHVLWIWQRGDPVSDSSPYVIRNSGWVFLDHSISESVAIMRPEKLVGFLYKTATKVAVKAALGSGAEVERAAFPLQQKSALPRPWMLVAPATFPIKLFTLTSLFAAFKLDSQHRIHQQVLELTVTFRHNRSSPDKNKMVLQGK